MDLDNIQQCDVCFLGVPEEDEWKDRFLQNLE